MYLAICPYFVCGCVILPLETLPPGDPSGGVVYLRIVLSPEEASHLMGFLTFVFYGAWLLNYFLDPKELSDCINFIFIFRDPSEIESCISLHFNLK